MSIRNYNKNHLNDQSSHLFSLAPTDQSEPTNDPLCFWTLHPKEPVFVDLNVFRVGETKRSRAGGNYQGGFSGRPDLIFQLAPYVRAIIDFSASRTVTQYLCSLRTWWRLFDSIEKESKATQIPVRKVSHISDVGEIHRRRALDDNMNRSSFHPFVAILELARNGEGYKALHWVGPQKRKTIRDLPPKWQTDQLRFALKHGWFNALHRWRRSEALISNAEPLDNNELRLRNNYLRFREVVHATGDPRPSMEELHGADSNFVFLDQGYKIADMLRGFYPDGTDIKMAFHLCLANTGWNPAVLLALDISQSFIEPHPKDHARYLMRSYKARGQSEQVTEGLYKTEGSPGVVIETLITRTAPLRSKLKGELAALEVQLIQLLNNTSNPNRSSINQTKTRIVDLRKGVTSPWLFVTSATKEIRWLHANNYNRSNRVGELCSFIDDLTLKINKVRPADSQIPKIHPSDFRDAFAAYAYKQSGGMIMHVMKALGHKSPTTTQTYLDNSLLNSESTDLYRTFSGSLWKEIELHGRVDPSIIAKWTRDGIVNPEHRHRLIDYRSLRRSRIGIGCKDPYNPPKTIAPHFKADGKSMCPVQRCTLCVEHAVIFPESLSGLCKRLAELRYLKSRMSIGAFLESNFREETANTELALTHFSADEVKENLDKWENEIALGSHLVIEFDGV